MTEPSHAVFLSYASQDAQAAQKICEALRAAGIEVFLDQSELRGGDAWDQKIRHEIHNCALFVPVISANTASRHEGYFRLEWDLADQRSHMMARSRVFVVPVCLDATTEAAADVPESFKRVQWTRLPGGDTPPAFLERVRRLLSPEPPITSRSPVSAVSGAGPATREPVPRSRLSKPVLLAIVAVIVFAALAYFVAKEFGIPKHTTPETAARVSPAPAAFAPPPHSIAVLPFINMSGDKDQEYFSDGLTEELLNSLTRIKELQVAARTSAFSFKGKDTDISTIARKLNVASVLEGSVRRSGNTVRITAQLINAVTGFHLWSETYDRDLSDILKLQTDIAIAVTGALKVTLLGDISEKIELGGTHNPDALDAYLRGRKALLGGGAKALQDSIAALSEAIRLDPSYALAFAVRSRALSDYATQIATGPAIRETFDKAQADARRAVALAPDLDESHLALALSYQTGSLNFALANDEYERALSLAPSNVRTLWRYSSFTVLMGRAEAAIAAARRAVTLDPLEWVGHSSLGQVLYYARKYDEALAAYKDALALLPDAPDLGVSLGLIYYTRGDLQSARASCESQAESPDQHLCLALIYHKLGRHADAEIALGKVRAEWGDSAALLYSAVYAQWGNTTKALEWLDTAVRLRDPQLIVLKTDPLLDPIRKEPRFQAIERELKFPN